MQHNIDFNISNIRRIASKEISLFFASPIAYLFLVTFAIVTLFVFFWVEAFFARNIADIRPMFQWMPLLLIFLSAALTMRLWSEERRSGTLEFVLTQSIPVWHFVVGKFLGCLVLLLAALLVTLPLPITVSFIGNLDWGVVWAGYLATGFMGGVYLSIGLYVSSRSDSQIVSLISASLLSGLFYLAGSPVITDFFGNQVADWLRLLGTGSRFESITRGVIDLRDIYYYISLIVVFLALNVLSLEKERWVEEGKCLHHRQWRFVIFLIVANAIVSNLWLDQLNDIRVDVTNGGQHSISEATKGYLDQLQEPLLLRGYFSGKTHPLLSPLVPQIFDLIKEYEVLGDGKVRVEFVDPLDSPQIEQEANQKYGIQPVPFQLSDRYQSSIVSSYFNVLVQYGDVYQILGFRDLIEIHARSESDIDVKLRNPEHDITRAIKRVLREYQAGGNLFDAVEKDLFFTAYVSEDSKLPEQLVKFKSYVRVVADQVATDSSGQFSVAFIDPDDQGGQIAKQIGEEYGFKPMEAGLFGSEKFFFHLVLKGGDRIIQIPFGNLTEEALARNLNAGIKRFASGFTKTVAFVTPESDYSSPYSGGGVSFSKLESFLGMELNILQEDLSDGEVSSDADILLLLASKNLNQKQLFAVDQFLMKGGTVIVTTSPYTASLSSRDLGMQKQTSGLENWLAHHGLGIKDSLVLDSKNSPFPLPIIRDLGEFRLQELRILDYPYFADIRGKGLSSDNLITAKLPQATIAWPSPIILDEEKNKSRQVTRLLSSSEKSWTSTSLDVIPEVSSQGVVPFTSGIEQKSHLLGVVAQGRFDSFFVDRFLPNSYPAQDGQTDKKDVSSEDDEGIQHQLLMGSVIGRSPDSSGIILFSSNDFLRDQVLQMISTAQQVEYVNTIQMMANAVDWALEDEGLLGIRSRGHFNRILLPMDKPEQIFWEYVNYIATLSIVLLIAVWGKHRRAARNRKYLELFTQHGGV